MCEEKSNIYFAEETSPLEVYLPAYLPPEFKRFDKSLWCNKTYKGLQAFYKNGQGKVIRLELSDGPIDDPMSMSTNQTRDFQKEVHGVPVSIKNIRLERSTGGSNPDSASLLTAKWNHCNVYFSLWSDGLTSDEAEKVIDSTLHQSVPD